jgi:outer membrane protein assembly factor BamB
MVDVELVDDEPPRGEPDPVTEWLRRIAGAAVLLARRAATFVGHLVVRAWRRPALRWVTLGVVAAVVVVPVVDASRERTRLAALAQVPGVLQPLHAGLRVLYSMAGNDKDAAALRDGFLLGDGVVGSLSVFGENTEVVGLDAATGSRRWSTPLGDRDAWGDAVPWCTPAGGVVACQVTGGPGRAGGATVAATWALDPADGHLLRTHAYGDHVRAVVAGGLMVVAAQVAGADRAPATGPWTVTWRVTGEDPATGSARWTWTSPPLAVSAEDDPFDPFHDPADYGSRLWATTDDAVLRIGDDTWLLGPDGTLRLHVARPGGWSVAETRGGSFVRQPMERGAVQLSRPRELLVDDGSWRPLDGIPLPTTVDDGSAPDLILMTTTSSAGTALTAVDRHTGSTRWQASLGAAVTGPLRSLSGMVLEGRVLTGLEDLRGLDAATGSPLWTVAGAGGWLSTDGSVVVVATSDAQGFPLGVAAYSPGDGRARWSTDVRALLAAQGRPLNLSLITFDMPVRHIGAVRADGTLAVLG